jgi:hypothetical protein
MLEDYQGSEDELRERLRAAKQVFNARILENDLLFEAIKSSLKDEAAPDEDGMHLPTFSVEPEISGTADGKTKYGLLISHSGKHAAEGFDEMSFGLSLYSHVPIFELQPAEKGRAPDGIISKELAAHGTPAEREAAAQHYLNAYQELIKIFPDKDALAVDPVKGTIDLVRDLPHYQIDDTEESGPQDS